MTRNTVANSKRYEPRDSVFIPVWDFGTMKQNKYTVNYWTSLIQRQFLYNLRLPNVDILAELFWMIELRWVPIRLYVPNGTPIEVGIAEEEEVVIGWWWAFCIGVEVLWLGIIPATCANGLDSTDTVPTIVLAILSTVDETTGELSGEPEYDPIGSMAESFPLPDSPDDSSGILKSPLPLSSNLSFY